MVRGKGVGGLLMDGVGGRRDCSELVALVGWGTGIGIENGDWFLGVFG